ncbi:hypothetical protein [Jiella pelagia]|uniref:Uncharacterized protein n=1 Tax=Jiella pelagia TaxID=2986949 RepID=A0ABY7BYK6_9HYPH|nr:hypothetical protein [Jiella pelagia]WAP68947.1 hypothetical protein OH818_27720 [Jiella pelagia]
MPQIVDAPDVCQGAFGLSRVADQQFGGAMMAIWGGLPHMGGAGAPGAPALGTRALR